jgi:hypothetical protein
MSDLSGATSIGGMVVTIGGDDSQLRSVVSRAKSDLQSASQAKTVFSLTMDTSSFDQQFSHFSSITSKMVEQAKVAGAQIKAAFASAGPSGPYGIKDATTGAYDVAKATARKSTAYSTGFLSWSEKDEDNKKRFLSAMEELESTGTKKTESESRKIRETNEKRAKEAKEAGRKIASAHDDGASEHGGLSHKNLLSRRGLETLGIGGSATAAFAILEAVSLLGEGLEAINSSSHPERILRSMQHVGAASIESYDPGAKAMAQVIATSKAQETMLSAAEGIPILGSLVRVGAAALDVHGKLADTQEFAARNIQVGEFLHKTDIEQRVRDAQLKGDSVSAYDVTENEKIAGLRAEAGRGSEIEGKIEDERQQRQRSLELASAGGSGGTYHPTTYTYTREDILRDHPEYQTGLDKAVEAQKALDHETKISTEEHKQLQWKVDNAKAGLMSQAERSSASAGISGILSSRTTGSIEWARKQKQADDTQALKEAGQQIQKDGNPLYESQVKSSTEAKKALAAKQASEDVDTAVARDAKINKNYSDAATTRLQIDRKYYAAKLQTADDAAAAENKSLAGASLWEKISARVRQGATRNAIVTENSRMVFESIGTSIGSIGSSILSAQGYGFQGSQFARRIQQQQQLAGIESPLQRAVAAMSFGAENFAAQRQYDYEGKSIDIGLNASIAADHARQKNEPLTASVIEQGAQVVESIRNARGDKVDLTRKAGLEKLETLRHNLFDPHSGGYAAVGSAFMIPGDPLGLTNQAKDRADAAKKLDEAKEDAKNEEGQTAWTLEDVQNLVRSVAKMAGFPANLIGNG